MAQYNGIHNLFRIAFVCARRTKMIKLKKRKYYVRANIIHATASDGCACRHRMKCTQQSYARAQLMIRSQRARINNIFEKKINIFIQIGRALYMNVFKKNIFFFYYCERSKIWNAVRKFWMLFCFLSKKLYLIKANIYLLCVCSVKRKISYIDKCFQHSENISLRFPRSHKKIYKLNKNQTK